MAHSSIIRATLPCLLASAICAWTATANAAEQVAVAPESPPTTSPSSAPKPVREGFTLELGLGGAMTFISTQIQHVTYDQGQLSSESSTETTTQTGFAPLALGIGGFLSEDWALLFRASGTSFSHEGKRWMNTFSGIAVQHWPSDRIMLGAGLGMGIFTATSGSSSGSATVDRGFSFSARAGYSIMSGQSNALRLAMEITPAFYEHTRVTGVAMGLDWQLL